MEVAERVGFEPTATPIEISKFMKTLQLCVPSGPLLSPLLAVRPATRHSLTAPYARPLRYKPFTQLEGSVSASKNASFAPVFLL
jgi:hypothetical protein